LSLQAGLSESMVGKIEAGHLEPSLKTFARLAVQLRLSRSEIAVLVLLVGQKHNPDGDAAEPA
jgi:predicted transcriptional regulator